MRYSPVLVAGVLSLALTLPNAHAEQRHHEAHVHGQGQLNLAIEDDLVHMELKLPAHDILGFETINNKDQQQALDSALAQLKSLSLWEFPKQAQCQLTAAEASSHSHQDTAHDDHHNEKKHDDRHHKHHDDNHHDEHHSDRHSNKKHNDHHYEHHQDNHHNEHHDSHQADNYGGHMDISATYTFKCKSPKAIKTLSTDIFEQFERSESIKVQAITPNGQHSKTLSRTTPEVKF